MVASSGFLVSLDLSGNRVGDAGAAALGAALKANVALRSLDLRSNGVGAAGLLAVARGMSINSTLRNLALWGNNFPASSGADGAAGEDCISAFDVLLRGRFAHLDVAVDIRVYAVDGALQVARA